jgi:hypothetical protein
MAREVYVYPGKGDPSLAEEKPKTVDQTLQEMKTKIRQQTGLPEETSGVGAGMLLALSKPRVGPMVDEPDREAPKPKRARPQSKRFDREALERAASDKVLGLPYDEDVAGDGSRMDDEDIADAMDAMAGRPLRLPLDPGTGLPVDPKEDALAIEKAKSMMNPNIYDAPNPEAYQDMVNADFNQYVNFPEQAGTREYYTLDDDDTDIEYHVFDREDGVNVVFAETPDGAMYNVTDTHGMDLE